ncbi:hypothetical protein [Mycoplasma sp. Z386]
MKEKLRSLKNFSITNLILTFSGLILFIITLAFAAGVAATQSAEGALAACVGLVGSLSIVGFVGSILGMIFSIWQIVAYILTIVWSKKDAKALN